MFLRCFESIKRKRLPDARALSLVAGLLASRLVLAAPGLAPDLHRAEGPIINEDPSHFYGTVQVQAPASRTYKDFELFKDSGTYVQVEAEVNGQEPFFEEIKTSDIPDGQSVALDAHVLKGKAISVYYVYWGKGREYTRLLMASFVPRQSGFQEQVQLKRIDVDDITLHRANQQTEVLSRGEYTLLAEDDKLGEAYYLPSPGSRPTLTGMDVPAGYRYIVREWGFDWVGQLYQTSYIINY